VRVAGAGSKAPFGNMIISAGLELPGMATADRRPRFAQAYLAVITPGYAEALGMRILEGRFFREADIASPVLPILVNASFAKRYFADGKAATGRRFTGILGADKVVEVVGVVADVLPASLDAAPQPQIYTLHGSPMKMDNATLVVRTDADASTLAPLLRQLVEHLDPGASLDQVGSLGAKISASVFRAALHDAGADSVFGTGAGACRDRPLRRSVVHRGTAPARDRSACRPRRHAR
jgi:hypothetical protein